LSLWTPEIFGKATDPLEERDPVEAGACRGMRHLVPLPLWLRSTVSLHTEWPEDRSLISGHMGTDYQLLLSICRALHMLLLFWGLSSGNVVRTCMLTTWEAMSSKGKKYMYRSSEQDMATDLNQDNTNDRKETLSPPCPHETGVFSCAICK
jgi:hypothetical protein